MNTSSISREPRPAGFAHPFLEAARGRTPCRPPVWIMRQAGRYLPDYRRVRKLFPGFLDFCRSPEHVAEVTVQPVDQIGVDAAILFSDILVLLPPLGLNLEFVEGEGPVVHNPIRDAEAIAALPDGDLNADLDYVFQGIQLTLDNLDGYVPLIGFAGGPFTVASYMVEGGSSKELARLKGLMFSNPKASHLLLEKLADRHRRLSCCRADTAGSSRGHDHGFLERVISALKITGSLFSPTPVPLLSGSRLPSRTFP